MAITNIKKSDGVSKREDLNISVRSDYLSKWRNQASESSEIINDYVTRRNNQEWMSADDISRYQSALERYKNSTAALMGIQKSSGNYNEEDEKKWNEWITNLSTDIDDSSEMFGKFNNEEAYKEAVASTQEYEELLALDLDAFKKDVDYYKTQSDNVSNLRKQINRLDGEISTLEYAANFSAERRAELEEKKKQRAAWGQMLKDAEADGWDAKWSEANAKYNRAKYIQNGIKLTNDALGAEDFADKSVYVSTKVDKSKLSWWERANTSAYDSTYEYINNVDGMRRKIESAYENTYTEDGITPPSTEGSPYLEKGYHLLSDDEVKVYNYYYATGGKEQAQKYLDSIQETLYNRRAKEMFSGIKDQPFLEYVFGFNAGVDQFASGMANSFNFKDDYIPVNATQQASRMVREDLADNGFNVWYNFKTGEWEDTILGSSVGQVAYDSITTTANMLPSILTSTVANFVAPGSGAIIGAGMMGTSAAGNAYQEMLNLGYDKGQARTYSTLVGISEAGLQYALGGFSKLGGKLSNNVISKVIGGIDNGFARFAIQLGGSVLSEGIEEGLQEIIDPLLKNAILHADEDIDWEQVAYSALLGSLSAFGLEGPGVIANNVSRSIAAGQEGKSIVNQGGVESLVALANEMAGVGEEYGVDLSKRVGRVNRENGVNTRAVGNLSMAVNDVRVKQNRNDIVMALESNGISSRKAQKYADIIAENNYELGTAEEWQKITGDADSYNVIRSVMESSVYSRNAKYGRARVGVKTADDGTISLTEEKAKMVERDILAGKYTEEADGIEVTVSKDGKAKVISTDTEVTLQGIDHIETEQVDGKETDVVYLKVADADGTESTVAWGDVEFANRTEAVLYESFVNMGLDPAHFDDYIKNFNEADFDTSIGEAAIQYAHGFANAYRYGWANLESEVGSDVFASKLTETARNIAYTIGKEAVTNNTEAKQAALDIAVEARKASGKGKARTKGKFHMADSIKTKPKKNFTRMQQAGIGLAKRISELGIDVYLYESKYVNGRYVDENGDVAANGFFRAKDGSIHIDINAGDRGQGVMTFAIAHELVHYMRVHSPKKFKAFADLLFKWYGEKGKSVNELIEQRMAEENLSWDDAYEEVVARSCESFLTDSNIADRIIELQQTDKGLWETIRDKVLEFLDWMKSLFKDVDVESEEGRFVREFKGGIDHLYDAFYNTLADAVETHQWVGSIAEAKTNAETLATAGITVDTDTGSAVMNSVRYAPKTQAEIDKVAKALAESVGVSIDKAKAWVKSETSLASIILDPSNAMFLDYEVDDRYEAIKKNAEYPQGTVDFSNLCKKRREFTALLDKLQREHPNRIITAEEMEQIRQILIEENVEVACGLCYVEERRQLLGEIAQGFIDGYKDGTLKESIAKGLDASDTYVPTIYDLITYDGYRALTAEHPSIAEAFKKYNNARGMQAGRLIEGIAEYKRDILSWSQKKVDFVNSVGGLRVFSFSDFEATHLIDLVQVIQDCAAKGVMIQAYTKVPAFANAVKDTHMKVNRSLIAKGTGIRYESGRMVLDLDPVEGIDIHDKDFFDSTESESVGNVLVGMSDEQIRLAMKTPFVDYIIPFHTGLKKDILKAKKIDHWDNYKNFQTDKDIATGKVAKNQINVYVDVIQAAEAEGKPIRNKVDFVNKFLAVAKERGLKPRFWQFLDVDANGEYVYTEGYHKFLVDFKLFDKDGNILPQKPVVPVFDDALNARILSEYVAGKKAPVSRDGVYDRIVREVINGEGDTVLPDGTKYSKRRSFAEQVDEVIAGTFARGNDVYVGETSQILADVGLNGDLAMLTKARKIKKALLPKDEKLHNHGLTPQQIKSLPEKIGNPVMIMDSLDPSTNSVVVVTDMLDADGSPVIVAVKADGKGMYNDIDITSNFLTSYYGKDGFANFIDLNVAADTFLFIDKEKSRKLSSQAKVQFFGKLGSYDFDVIIRQTKAVVKRNPETGTVEQKISSAKTSIKQIPALFKDKNVVFAKTNIDIGGGKFDLATEFLAERGTRNYVFDPYNRSEESNSNTLAFLQSGNRADTATCANVLNVIAEEGARANVILEVAKSIKADGVAYFMVYEGDSSGVGRETSSGWQNNRKTADYMQEISKYFESVERKGKLIIAKKPVSNLPKATWEVSPGKGIKFSKRQKAPVSRDAVYDRLEREVINGEGIKKSTRKSGLATYDEAQYNAFGWASYNGVITAKERSILLSRFADFKHNRNKYPVTKWGEAVIYSTECPDVIMYVRASSKIAMPEITRIVRMKFDDIFDIVDVEAIQREVILYEQEQVLQPYEDVELIYGEEIFRTYKKRDSISFQEYLSREEGRGSETSVSDIKRFQDGGRSGRSGVEGNRTDDRRVKKSSRRDSTGRELTEAQDEFFKDSKVRDADGNLLVCYHGTDADFNIFDADYISADNKLGFGFYFMAGKRLQYEYEHTIAAYLNITNPITDTSKMLSQSAVEAFCKKMGIAIEHFADNDNDLDTYERLCYSYNGDTKAFLQNAIDILGVDGVISEDRRVAVAFAPNQIKSTANLNPTKGPDIRYQRRGTGMSNRSILANALESATQHESEARRLAEYKEKIDLINAEEEKLREVRARIAELSFASGPKDTATIKRLQETATRIASRINTYDKQLLSLEATAPLRALLEREKAAVRKRETEKTAEALARYREKSAETIREVTTQNTESRKRSVESRKRTVARNKIKRVVADLNGLLNRGTKERNVKTDMRETVGSALRLANVLFNDEITNEDIVLMGSTMATEEEQKLLEQYMELIGKRDSAPVGEAMRYINKISDLNRKLADLFKRERARLNQAKVSEAVDELAKAYAGLKVSDKDYVSAYYSEEAYQRLLNLSEALGGTVMKDMSLEQLEEVYNACKMIRHIVRESNSLFRMGKTEDLAKTVTAVQEEILSYYRELEKDPRFRGKKAGDIFKGFLWNEMKPLTAFETLGSEKFTELFWDAIKAESEWAKWMEESKTFLDEQRKKFGYKSWDMETAHEFTLPDGKVFRLTLQDMMSIYAYSKRDQAQEHMTVGGFQFDKNNAYKDKSGKKRVRLGDLYATDWSTIVKVIGELTDEQRGYVDAVQQYLTDMGKRGNEVSEILYGIGIFNETAYFPLMSAKDYRSSVEEAFGNTQTIVSLKNTGMTKQTVPHASNPIILQAFDDVVIGHIDKMAKYCTHVLAIENLRRVFDSVSADNTGGYISTKAVIEKVFGEGAKKYINKYITDLNGGVLVDDVDSPMMQMFSKFKGTAVGASLSVVIQQPFAVIRAMDVIDPKHFIFGNAGKAETKRLYDEIMRYAPVAIIKEMGGFDVGSSRTARDYLGSGMDKGILDKVNDVAMYGAGWADRIGWSCIWTAVKREIASEGKFKNGTEEFYKACGERFTEVIVRTQVYDSVNSRSGYMRSKNALHKFATSFMGEPTTVVNQAYLSVLDVIRAKDKQAKKKAIGKLGRTMGVLLASTVFTTAAKSLIYGMRDDDDDEAFLEKWAKHSGDNLRSDINPLSMLPYARDIVSIIEGWEVERPDMTLYANIITSAKRLIDGGATADELLAFIGDTANLFGIPAKNLIRDAKAIVNFFGDIFDDVKPTDVGGAFVSGFTGEDYTEKVRAENAFKKGDDVEVKRIVDGLIKAKVDSGKTEKEAKSAVRSSFTSTYKEQYVEAYKKGDLDEMNRIRKYLHATGLYGTLSELDASLKKWRED